MFRQQLETTPLTNEIANEYYSRISGDKFNYDSTLTATARALVYPRMTEENKLRIKISNINYKYANEEGDDVIIDYIFPSNSNEDELVLVNLTNGNEEDYTALMDRVEKNIKPGYVRVERATMFFQKVFQLRCYINEERRMSFIITGGIDTQRFHYMQCGILAYLPWYFPEASELDKELITSMRQRQPDEYLAILQRIADSSEMETIRLEKLLTGFQEAYFDRKLNTVEGNKRSAMDDIAIYRNRISELLDRIEAYDIELLGLEAKKNEGGEGVNELLDYFKAYKKVLRLVKAEGNYITFETRQYLDIYDEDILESMLQNKRSYIYSLTEGYYSNADIEKLMRKIFMDREMKIRFCAAYRIDLRGTVSGLQHYNYDSSYGTYMPNTHIDEHSCLGNYDRLINEILEDGKDYTAAIDQCLASGRSLNWADTVVTKEFLRYLYKRVSGVNVKCIELPNGNVVDIDGALEYLKQEEKGE